MMVGRQSTPVGRCCLRRRCGGRRTSTTRTRTATATATATATVAATAVLLSSRIPFAYGLIPPFFSSPSAAASASAASSSSSPLRPRDRPCVGTTTVARLPPPTDSSDSGVAGTGEDQTAGPPTRVRYTVIGTSHYRCNSASEVRELIEDVRPDGVVVELDPERVIRLTKEGIRGSLVSSSSHGGGEEKQAKDEEQPFGADFLAAINVSRELDIPLFVGDEYTKETRSRLIRTAAKIDTYGPGRLMMTFFPQLFEDVFGGGGGGNGGNGESAAVVTRRLVDLPGTFLSDPLKLVPPLAAVSPALLLLLLTMPEFRYDDMGGNIAAILASVISFFVTCKVFNTFISDRDDVLARSAVHAANVVESLRTGETIRKTLTFTVNPSPPSKGDGSVTVSGNSVDERGANINIPLFTLKTPLNPGAVRNLNLFEPRWLKMIDGVVASSSSGRSEGEDNEGGSESDSESPSFGCVTCANKFYSAASVDGREGRYADVVFRRKGTVARLVDVTEGKRAISGDRKILTKIRGGDEFWIRDEGTVTVVDDGYLVASEIVRLDDGDDGENDRWSYVGREARKRRGDGAPRSRKDETGQEEDEDENEDEEEIHIVAVVGLLHANGIIERLSKT